MAYNENIEKQMFGLVSKVLFKVMKSDTITDEDKSLILIETDNFSLLFDTLFWIHCIQENINIKINCLIVVGKILCNLA